MGEGPEHMSTLLAQAFRVCMTPDQEVQVWEMLTPCANAFKEIEKLQA